MKTIDELLLELGAMNVKLWLDGDALRYRAPPGVMTPALAARLRDRKADIIAFLKRAGWITRSQLPPIEPTPRHGPLPLSSQQRRIWFLERLAIIGSAYNVPIHLRMRGRLDVEALSKSLTEIVRRHEILRSCYREEHGELVQVVLPATDVEIPIRDLSDLAGEQVEDTIKRVALEETQRRFDLERDPPIRAMLLQIRDDEHILLMTSHHIAWDGWSMRVFVRELRQLYESHRAGKAHTLPDLPVQYVDYAAWQRNGMEGEVLREHLAHWKPRLEGLTPLSLPTDHPRPRVETFRGGGFSFELTEELTAGILDLSRRHGATTYMILLAAFQVLLHRYTDQARIAVGSPIASRRRREIEGLIGFFVNTIVLCTSMDGDPSFVELLARVRDVVLDAFSYQDMPFERLVEELNPERDLGRNPLFQVMFALQEQEAMSLRFDLDGLDVRSLEFDELIASSTMDLELHMWQDGARFVGRCVYNADLFERPTIARMVSCFQTLLTAIVQKPERRLSELPMMPPSERQRVLEAWNDTTKPFPDDRCIHELFEAQVARAPDAIAAIFEAEHLTYGQLDARANRLAHYLRSLGVGPEILVGVAVERSLDMLVAILGILKAGGAYVPLDPSYPKGRLKLMLDDARVRVLLTHTHQLEHLPDHQARVVLLDGDRAEIDSMSDESPAPRATPDNLAYIIYTSGSTGRPKGVMVPHRGLCSLAGEMIRTFGVEPQSRVLQFASLNFDASIMEIIMALPAGAALVLAPRAALLPGAPLVRLLRKQGVTTALLPPSALAALPSDKDPLPAWQTIISGGEACSAEIVGRWGTSRRFFNAYGPTEITICATIALCAPDGAAPPIGRPVDNARCFVLDARMQPVPIGVPGELYIAGVGVSRGYLARPGLTAERFVPSPFSEVSGERLYRTGDRVRYRENGDIEFLGRVDDQIKIRGFRIELGEIDALLRRHPSVQDVAVLVRELTANDKRLVAYIVPQQNASEHIAQELQDYLRGQLPDYMVPSAFMVMARLPLSPSGKIDRAALPAPSNDHARSDGSAGAPKTDTEKRIAAIWGETLGVENLRTRDNFFDVGGHSLLVARVHERLQETMARDIPIVALFQYPTIDSLAEYLTRLDEEDARSSLLLTQSRERASRQRSAVGQTQQRARQLRRRYD